LDVLILKALALEPQHGWAIGERIKQISKDLLIVQQGSVYPALLFQQSIRAEREHQYVRLGSYSATPPFCHTGASAVRATAIRKAFHRWCVTIATDAGGR
jgi:hypothetical protein